MHFSSMEKLSFNTKANIIFNKETLDTLEVGKNIKCPIST